MAVNPERGGAIMFLFIAVALFGALGYAFLQGSRNSTSMITGEAAKATAYQSQDCSNSVTMATKRLQARGCAGKISSAADGSNPFPGAPTDGSCSIYHPNGGGVKNCGYVAPADTCMTGPIGTVCTSDGATYIGMVSGNRIYVAAANESNSIQIKNVDVNTPGATSFTNGLANTNAFIAGGAPAHPAAQACTNKSPSGTWYVPARDEMNLLWTNRTSAGGPLDLNAMGIIATFHWTSTNGTVNPNHAFILNFSNGTFLEGYYTNALRLRCARR